MSNGYNFSGIPALDAQDPGPVATGTIPSAEIPDWITRHVPGQFQPAYPGGIFKDASGAITDPSGNIFSTRGDLANPAAAAKEALVDPDAVPYTAGLLKVDPIDALVAAITGGVGSGGAGHSAVSGGLRNFFRFRLGSPANMDEVAEVLQRTAPAAMRPAQATAEGISDVVRTGAGMGAIRTARDATQNAIASELNAITAQQQAAAAQGLTGVQAQQAMARVPDLASRFRELVTELLPDAGRAMANPVTGVTRPGVGALPAARAREAIYQDLQALLTPDQWRRYLASQTEYAQGSTLGRLFAAGKGATDVLLDRQALQEKARTVQAALNRISPDILRTIFRGGEALAPDTPVTLPIGFGQPGVKSFARLPATILAGPADASQAFIARLLGGAGGALGGGAALQTVEGAPPGEPIPDPSFAAFLKNLNPFLR